MSINIIVNIAGISYKTLLGKEQRFQLYTGGYLTMKNELVHVDRKIKMQTANGKYFRVNRYYVSESVDF